MAVNPAERRGVVISLVPKDPRSEFGRRLDLVDQGLDLALGAAGVFRWDNPANAFKRAEWADANYRQEARDRRALWDSYHSIDRVQYSVEGSFIYKSSQVELEIDEMRRIAEAESQGLRAAGLNFADYPSSGLAFGERVPKLHVLIGGIPTGTADLKAGEALQTEKPAGDDYSFRLTYASGPVVDLVLKSLYAFGSAGDVYPKVLEAMQRFSNSRAGSDNTQEAWEVYSPKLDPDQLNSLDDYIAGKSSLAVPRYFPISAWDPNRKAGQTEAWVRASEEAKRPV